MDLIEGQGWRCRELAAKDGLAVFGNVPAKVARRIREEASSQRRFSDLSRAGHKDHFSLEIRPDRIFQVPFDHALSIATFFCPCQIHSRSFPAGLGMETGRAPVPSRDSKALDFA